MNETPIVIDAEKVTMGDLRRLSQAFSYEGMYALLKRCSSLTTEAELDALTLPEMRQVMEQLQAAISGALVPKAR